MERELWRAFKAAAKNHPRTRPRNAVYTDIQIATVYAWAVMNDRPVSWACDRGNWPDRAWRCPLPDQSTMSRRMRRPKVLAIADAILARVQRDFELGDIMIVDGKPLELSEHTRDPDARTGRGAGRYAKGYKLHLVLDQHSGAVLAFETHPLNTSETTTATAMVSDPETPVFSGGLLLGDALYDSNELHQASADRGVQLAAPRKKPGTGLGRRRHHPNRLKSIEMTEGDEQSLWKDVLGPCRDGIERFFGTLASYGGGLYGLPPWVRRLHRVRLWVAFKLVFNAIRIAAKRAELA